MALDSYNLRDEINKLKEHKNFLFTKIWPEYANVIEFFESKNCFGVLTDSGGVQEEMNLLNKVCLTCRFNTDRPETVNQAKSNLLVPPIDKEFITNMIEHVYKDEELQKTMINSKNLYGEKVGEKFISEISKLMEKDEKPFKWAHESLNLWKEEKGDFEYL